MKKTIKITTLFIVALLSASMTNKESVDIKTFINAKWKIDGSKTAIIVCFKSDNTFWHYTNIDSKVDSIKFSNWGIEKDKLYFSDESVMENKKFSYFKIISCNKEYMIVDDFNKKDTVKLKRY